MTTRIAPPLPRAAHTRLRLAALGGVLAVVTAACGGAAGATPTAGSASPGAPTATSTTAPTPGATPATPVALTVGLGYIPNVQFAPFYLADQAGYYRDAGLDVTFQNKVDADLVPLVGQGTIDIGVADGTSVIPAVSQGIPVRYIYTVYADFPAVVFAKASSGITKPADLAGKRIGIPGKYGSSWIQLLALLASAGLTSSDVTIVTFPDYGQLTALEQGVVDAAAGFVNNEPIRMELSGTPAVVLALPADSQLPGNGLIVGQGTLDGPKADAVRRFVEVTRRAMTEIVANPQVGVDAAVARIPELASDRDAQLAVLKATITAWEGHGTNAGPLGAIDTAVWERSIAFMSGLPGSPVAKPITVADCVDLSFSTP